jgi:hypothetical protein
MMTQRRCTRCGATNPLSGLTDRQSYRGGVGYSWDVECRDRDACARREAREASLLAMQTQLEATREQRRVLR